MYFIFNTSLLRTTSLAAEADAKVVAGRRAAPLVEEAGLVPGVPSPQLAVLVGRAECPALLPGSELGRPDPPITILHVGLGTGDGLALPEGGDHHQEQRKKHPLVHGVGSKIELHLEHGCPLLYHLAMQHRTLRCRLSLF